MPIPTSHPSRRVHRHTAIVVSVSSFINDDGRCSLSIHHEPATAILPRREGGRTSPRPSGRQNQPPWNTHNDDHVVETHPGDVDQVDCQDLVAELETAAAVDGAVDGDPRDEDAIHAVQTVALADVETEGLTGTLHNLYEADLSIRILCEKSKLGI